MAEGDYDTPAYVTTQYVEQEIEIKTVQTTEYMKQPVIDPSIITHSMSPGALADQRPHNKDQFTITYELKGGEPAVVSSAPFTSYTGSEATWLTSTSPFNGLVLKIPVGDLVESVDRKFESAAAQSG